MNNPANFAKASANATEKHIAKHRPIYPSYGLCAIKYLTEI